MSSASSVEVGSSLDRSRFRRSIRRHGWPLLLVTPVAVILLLFMYAPILDAVRLSLTDASLLRPGQAQAVGLDNYLKIATSKEFWGIAGQTILWSVASVAGACVLGVLAAVLLTTHRRGRPLRGRVIIGGLILAPFVAPPVVSAYTWIYLYSGSGPINGVLNALGATEPVYFLGDTVTKILGVALPLWSMIQVGVWHGFPFFFLMVAAALTSIPVELHEAAEIDGATGWRSFRSITLPLIAPVLEVTIFLELLFRLGGLDLPFLLTGGGPLGLTNVWGVFIYQVGFARLEIGYGAALGVVLFLICTPFAIWYVRRSRRQLAGF